MRPNSGRTMRTDYEIRETKLSNEARSLLSWVMETCENHDGEDASQYLEAWRLRTLWQGRDAQLQRWLASERNGLHVTKAQLLRQIEGAVDYCGAYLDALRKAISSASKDALAICQAWHDEQFGLPGWGSANWVVQEIQKAEQAVELIRERERH